LFEKYFRCFSLLFFVLLWYMLKQVLVGMGVPGGGGGGGGGSPPSLLGKQSQLGNIRFTVGKYWLIIKINGTNSVNFVGNMLSNRNFS
jgi:hypothetical protein